MAIPKIVKLPIYPCYPLLQVVTTWYSFKIPLWNHHTQSKQIQTQTYCLLPPPNRRYQFDPMVHRRWVDLEKRRPSETRRCGKSLSSDSDFLPTVDRYHHPYHIPRAVTALSRRQHCVSGISPRKILVVLILSFVWSRIVRTLGGKNSSTECRHDLDANNWTRLYRIPFVNDMVSQPISCDPIHPSVFTSINIATWLPGPIHELHSLLYLKVEKYLSLQVRYYWTYKCRVGHLSMLYKVKHLLINYKTLFKSKLYSFWTKLVYTLPHRILCNMIDVLWKQYYKNLISKNVFL